jgi:hypothetical protein
MIISFPKNSVTYKNEKNEKNEKRTSQTTFVETQINHVLDCHRKIWSNKTISNHLDSDTQREHENSNGFR